MDSALSLAGKPLAPAGEKDPAVADNPASTLNKFLIEAKTGKVGNDVFATCPPARFLAPDALLFKITHGTNTQSSPRMSPSETIRSWSVPLDLWICRWPPWRAR